MYKENTKERAITLIALVVTIIIMLILVGISISTLSDGGLLDKIKLAKQEHIESEVREKISLIVTEYAIEREKGKTLSEFLTEKKDTEEIMDFTDNGDGTFDIIINGYVTTMSESDLKTTEPVKTSNVIVNISANTFEGNKVHVDVTIKSTSSTVKEIRLIDGTKVQGNNQNTVNFDYEIEANTEYIIEVELSDASIITKTIKYEDTKAPTATIEIAKKLILNSGKIKANVKIEDNKSGVNIKKCKWVVLKDTSTNIGTDDESLYTNTFNTENETITTEEISEYGIYYIHLLLKDNLGNTSEVISEQIEIRSGYEIWTPDDFQQMGTADRDGTYYVMQDIDMAGYNFVTINGAYGLTLDGQGHTISNLSIKDAGDATYVAIFETVRGATFKNILFKDVDIDGANEDTALIAGCDYLNSGTLKFVKVGITGSISGSGNVGTFLSQSRSAKNVNFVNCYARVNLITKDNRYTGGFFGNYSFKNKMTFTNCYWAGTTNQTNVNYAGVFKPKGTSGSKNPTITDCFYNNELFNLSVSADVSGTGLTTSQFADSSNFTNWDFENTWYIGPDGYPELKF